MHFHSIITVERQKFSMVFSIMGLCFLTGGCQGFMKQMRNFWFPVGRDQGAKWRDWMKEERRGGMSVDERSQRRGEQDDRYGNEVKRETEIRTFTSLPLCIYPSKKKRVRPNKTFIIPGKLFNVFDIKRLKGWRDR